MSTQWLYLDVPRMKGPAVRRWQESLLALDYSLGKWGADGVFGDDTDAATKKFQATHSLKVDGIVGARTVAAATEEISKSNTVESVVAQNQSDVEIHDYRGKVAAPKNGRYTRQWSQITGVVLHRTACVLGEKPERWFPVNAHIGVTLQGRIILSHPWELMIWHGHAPSPWTIGIEFDGNPIGWGSYYWRPGGGPHPITDEQVRASEVLLEMLVQAFEQNGQKLRYVLAHRQSSDQRESDPGLECWQKIAMPWLAKTGATCGDKGHASTWGSGTGIPKQWDPASKIPFWKS